MEVASPAFPPRSAEPPRGNRDLIRARSHDRIEVDRVAADSDSARRGIVDRRNSGPPAKSISPSKFGTIELAILLIANSRQPIPIREVAAVPDDEGIGAIVAEAMRGSVHF